MAVQHISIPLGRGGPNDEIRYVETIAVVEGGLAIHREWQWRQRDDAVFCTDGWSITHVPTGRCLNGSHPIRLQIARLLVRMLICDYGDLIALPTSEAMRSHPRFSSFRDLVKGVVNADRNEDNE